MADEPEISYVIPADQIAASAITQTAQPTTGLAEAARTAVAELNVWVDQHICNTPFSRDTRAYNRIHAALTEIGSAIASVRE